MEVSAPTGAQARGPEATGVGLSEEHAAVLDDLRFELMRFAGIFEELRPDELRGEVDRLREEAPPAPASEGVARRCVQLRFPSGRQRRTSGAQAAPERRQTVEAGHSF